MIIVFNFILDIIGGIWDFICSLSIVQLVLLIIALIVLGPSIKLIPYIIKRKTKEAGRYIKNKGIAAGINDANDYYEEAVKNEIQRAFKTDPFENVILPWEDRATQADLVLVCSKGIFVFGCRSDYGYDTTAKMNVDFAADIWTVYDDEKISRVLNPIYQNIIHTNALQLALQKANPMLASCVPIFNVACVPYRLDGGPYYVGQQLYISELTQYGACIISTSVNLDNRNALRGIDIFKTELDRLPAALSRDGVEEAFRIISRYASNNDPERQKIARKIKREETADIMR